LLTAFGYQQVFQKPVSDIFPGLYHAVEAGVKERLEEFEREPGSSATNRNVALPAALDLEGISEGENHESV